MGKKEEFKEFVKQNPSLINHVKNSDMTWQKFYELYDLYGSDNDEIWKDYKVLSKNDTVLPEKTKTPDFLTWIKNVDLDSVNEGVQSIQRVLGVFGDVSSTTAAGVTANAYKPRPLYKHFDD